MQQRWLAIAMFVLVACACQAGDRMVLSETEIRESLKVGMDRSEVEAFFQRHQIGYAYTSREQAQMQAPPFPWKADDAVGYYGGYIRDVSTVWWMLASEHIHIQVEIDSNGKASQVIIGKSYTAP